MTDLMTEGTPITVRRRYVKPIPPDESIEKMNKKTQKFRTREKSRMCILCFNAATQMMCYDVDGATLIERYCDTCIRTFTVC